MLSAASRLPAPAFAPAFARALSATRRVLLGRREVAFPSAELGVAPDATEAFRSGDFGTLRKMLEEDGFLWIRGAMPREHVLRARASVLDFYGEKGGILDPARPLDEGVLLERCGMGCVPFTEGRNDLTHSDDVLRVLEAPELRALFKDLFEEEARTFDLKWLRGIPNDVR